MNAPAIELHECDLFFFSIGAQRFAADPLDIRRVDLLRDDLPSAELLASSQSRRALVTAVDGLEIQVPVDGVKGVRRVPSEALRKAPAFAALLPGPRAGELLGVVLEEGTPILVIDLHVLAARRNAPAERVETSKEG